MSLHTLTPFALATGLTLGVADAGCTAPAALTENPQAAATHEILRTLDDYFAAVNARDPGRFLTFFVPSEDLTVIEDRDLRLSRKAFQAFVESFFKDVAEVRAIWERRDVFLLAPPIAVATGTFRVTGKDAKGAPMAFRSAFTFVLVRRGGRWLVKHVHESSLDPAEAQAVTGE